MYLLQYTGGVYQHLSLIEEGVVGIVTLLNFDRPFSLCLIPPRAYDTMV